METKMYKDQEVLRNNKEKNSEILARLDDVNYDLKFFLQYELLDEIEKISEKGIENYEEDDETNLRRLWDRVREVKEELEQLQKAHKYLSFILNQTE